MIKTKKQMFTMIGAFLLVIMLGTITYAFFNYTRTGSNNTIKTGRIAFNTNQTDTINLTNVFPIDRSTIGTDTTNTDEIVISITGDTTYTEGLEYLVTAVDVNNTIGSGNNQKNIPISISVTASNLGEEDEEYFDNRDDANSHMYRVLANDVVVENGRIAVGYIKAGATGVNGTLTIKSYLDKDKIAITDTYDGEESDNMGTTTDWVDNRTILTTQEWNSLQTNGVSFKVKVESNEGIWVEEIRTVNAMNTFPTVITDEKANIKEVYFNKMGVTRMQNAYDAATIKADLTYNNEGKVLAWLEENQDDNTKYNLIVASDGETYFPSNCEYMFWRFTNLEKIEFNNINTSRVTSMKNMFKYCNSLETIDLSSFDTSNVTTMELMFYSCSSLVSIDLSNFDMSSITNMRNMLQNCSSLTSVDLSDLGGDQLTTALYIFSGDTNLQEINMSGFNFGLSTSLEALFVSLPNLKVVNLTNVKMDNVTNITAMFAYASNLEKIYVSNSWNTNNISNSDNMFGGATSLVGQAPNTSYAFDSNDAVDKTYARIATDDTKGYLTDISLKPTN